MRKAFIFFSLTLAALACVQNVSRAGVMTPLGTSQLNTIQFQDWENHYNSSGVLQAAGTSLALGDRLRGVLRVSNVSHTGFNNNPESTNHQITAVFDVKVSNVETTGSGQTVLTFAPDGAFSTNAIQPGGTSTIATSSPTGGLDFRTLGLSGNTMIAIYDNSSTDFTSPGGAFFDTGLTPTTMQAEQLATQGSLLGAFGYGTGGTAPGDIGAAGNGYWYSVGSFGGSFNFSYGLTLLAPPVGGTDGILNDLTVKPILNLQFSTNGFGGGATPAGSHVTDNYAPPSGSGTTFFDLTGIGHLTTNNDSQNGRTDLYQIASNDPANVFPNPEPSTLVLFGIGMCGLGIARRRRKVIC